MAALKEKILVDCFFYSFWITTEELSKYGFTPTQVRENAMLVTNMTKSKNEWKNYFYVKDVSVTEPVVCKAVQSDENDDTQIFSLLSKRILKSKLNNMRGKKKKHVYL